MSVLHHKYYGIYPEAPTFTRGTNWHIGLYAPGYDYSYSNISVSRDLVTTSIRQGLSPTSTSLVVVNDLISTAIISEYKVAAGDPVADGLYTTASLLDSAQNLYILGKTGNLSLSGFYVKLDSQGNELYQAVLTDVVEQAKIDNDGGIIAIGGGSVYKFTKSGPIQWGYFTYNPAPTNGPTYAGGVTPGYSFDEHFIGRTEQYVLGGVDSYSFLVTKASISNNANYNEVWTSQFMREDTNGNRLPLRGNISDMVYDRVNDVLYAVGYIIDAITPSFNSQGFVMKIDGSTGLMIDSGMYGSVGSIYDRKFTSCKLSHDGKLIVGGVDYISNGENNTSIFMFDTQTLNPIWEFASLPATNLGQFNGMDVTYFGDIVYGVRGNGALGLESINKIPPTNTITNAGTINYGYIVPTLTKNMTLAAYGISRKNTSLTATTISPSVIGTAVTVTKQTTPQTSINSPFTFV